MQLVPHTAQENCRWFWVELDDIPQTSGTAVVQTNKGSSSLLQSDLSCRNTKQTVGAIYTRTNFVTLKYVTDGWGTESNGFKLVITAFKDKSKYIHDQYNNISFYDFFSFKIPFCTVI